MKALLLRLLNKLVDALIMGEHARYRVILERKKHE